MSSTAYLDVLSALNPSFNGLAATTGVSSAALNSGAGLSAQASTFGAPGQYNNYAPTIAPSVGVQMRQFARGWRPHGA